MTTLTKPKSGNKESKVLSSDSCDVTKSLRHTLFEPFSQGTLLSVFSRSNVYYSSSVMPMTLVEGLPSALKPFVTLCLCLSLSLSLSGLVEIRATMLIPNFIDTAWAFFATSAHNPPQVGYFLGFQCILSCSTFDSVNLQTDSVQTRLLRSTWRTSKLDSDRCKIFLRRARFASSCSPTSVVISYLS